MNLINVLFLEHIVIGAWWNPFSWGDEIGNAIEAFQHMLSDLLIKATEISIEYMTDVFNNSIDALRSEVAVTPNDFGTTLVNTLKTLSDNVVLPIAGLLITYVFCLQIIEFVTEKNKGNDFDVGAVTFLIIKTAVMIGLATNSFTIALGFSDLSTWMIDQVPTEDVIITDEITDTIIEDLEPVIEDENGEVLDIDEIEDTETQTWNFKLGQGVVVGLISIISLVIAMIISGIIYLVAWTRMITILLYVTIAPIPMATVMSETWVNSIGQNYLKNLLALTLQGFLMLVLLVIYTGLLSRTATLIDEGQGAIQGMVLVVVSMAIIAKMLVGTHSFAKSITGAT